MREDISRYAQLGLCYHLLYPRCTTDPDYHLATLPAVLNRTDIEVLDLCVPYGEERRRKAIEMIRACGKSIVYAAHLLPKAKMPECSPNPVERAQVELLALDQIEVAEAAGAGRFVFSSGSEPGPPGERAAAWDAFAGFCRTISPRLREAGITGMIEPFDREIDQMHLAGPTSEVVAFLDSLRPQVDNIGIELDIAHLPLMGEAFDEAFKTVARYLTHVHFGNCVLRDPQHPCYGDKHPPIGTEGGEIDTPQLAEVLQILLDIGYLRPDRRGSIVLEARPLEGQNPDDVVADNFARIREAWRMM